MIRVTVEISGVLEKRLRAEMQKNEEPASDVVLEIIEAHFQMLDDLATGHVLVPVTDA